MVGLKIEDDVMRNWRASLGFIALVAVGLALLLPLQARAPSVQVPGPGRPEDRARGQVLHHPDVGLGVLGAQDAVGEQDRVPLRVKGREVLVPEQMRQPRRDPPR